MSRAILTYGEVSFSAYQIGLQAESISGMATFGFGVAATTLSAKAIGMRDATCSVSYFKGGRLGCVTVIQHSLPPSSLILDAGYLYVDDDQHAIFKDWDCLCVYHGFIQIPQNLSGILSKTLLASGIKTLL